MEIGGAVNKAKALALDVIQKEFEGIPEEIMGWESNKEDLEEAAKIAIFNMAEAKNSSMDINDAINIVFDRHAYLDTATLIATNK